MTRTSDLHIIDTTPLITPDQLRNELPTTERAANTVTTARTALADIITGRDRRLAVIVGPCSIHDATAAHDYAAWLAPLAARYADDLVVVMRVYFEKPRTTTGWKGLINDPQLDGSHDVATGLRVGRQLLCDLNELGLPAACEWLDPIIPQYLAGLVAWGAIGARTVESQTHREMASGLSMPVGLKNATDGGLQVAINGILAASTPHRFTGIDSAGRVSVFSTDGNPSCHAVLRGGSMGPNYHAEAVAAASDELRAAGVCDRVMIDCSHANSGKDHTRQPVVAGSIADQLEAGSRDILGVMIESNLVAGNQPFSPGCELVHGQSITDACVGLDETEAMLERLAKAVTQPSNA